MGKKDNDTLECGAKYGVRSPFEYEYEKYLIKEMKKQKKIIKKLRRDVNFLEYYLLKTQADKLQQEPDESGMISISLLTESINSFKMKEFCESPEDPLIREIVTSILLNANEEEVRKTVAKNLYSLSLLMNDKQKKEESFSCTVINNSSTVGIEEDGVRQARENQE